MAAEFATRFLEEEDYPRWAALVAASPGGSPYSHPDYVQALCRAAGGRMRVLVAERDGRILGGITLYERRTRFGWALYPRRLLYYNGIVLMRHESTYPSQRTSLDLQTLTAIEAALSAAGYARLRLKSRLLQDIRVFREKGWADDPTYTYVVDFSDPAAAWQRVDKNLRRLVGRCQEQGFTAGTEDDFEAFFRLHDETHLRKGGPLYLPHEAFRGFFEELRAKRLARIYVARASDGRVAAAQLVLVSDHPVTHSVAAGTDEAFLNVGASAFLRWKVFEHLAADGYKANDLTDAHLNPVTHFKSQLGGELELNLELSRPDHFGLRVEEGTRAAASRAKRVARRFIRKRG